jgi:hypothetical protein
MQVDPVTAAAVVAASHYDHGKQSEIASLLTITKSIVVKNCYFLSASLLIQTGFHKRV